MVRSVQDQQRDLIPGPADPVDGFQGRLDELEPFVLSPKGQTRHVLHQEGARAGIAQNAEKGSHGIRARVVKTASVTGGPIARL